jgi:CDP-diacylglycerol--serine O-phosphatidyltransferase
MLFPFVNQHTLDNIISNPFLIAAVAIILSIMLVTEIPLFALKFKNLSWKDNSTRFIFLISSAVLLIVLGILAIPVIILYYILLSIITKKKQS